MNPWVDPLSAWQEKRRVAEEARREPALAFLSHAIERWRLAMKNRIRVLRTERGWSQAELAQRLGVSRQTVIAIEKGKYDPSLPLAFRIARTFGLPIEAIFEYEENGYGKEA